MSVSYTITYASIFIGICNHTIHLEKQCCSFKYSLLANCDRSISHSINSSHHVLCLKHSAVPSQQLFHISTHIKIFVVLQTSRPQIQIVTLKPLSTNQVESNIKSNCFSSKVHYQACQCRDEVSSTPREVQRWKTINSPQLQQYKVGCSPHQSKVQMVI